MAEDHALPRETPEGDALALSKTHGAKYGVLFDKFREASNEDEVFVKAFRDSVDLGRPRERLLDIGANDGHLLENFLADYDEVVVVEPDPQHRHALEALGVTHLEGKWEEVSPTQPADEVVAVHVLYHFEDVFNQCLRMLRVLKPKGRAFIVYNAPDGTYAAFLRRIGRKLGKDSSAYKATVDFRRALRRSRLEHETRSLAAEVSFHSWHHFRHLCQFIFNRDLAVLTPVMDELKTWYDNLPACPNRRGAKRAPIELAMTILQGDATAPQRQALTHAGSIR